MQSIDFIGEPTD